ncbi:MAG TPA: MFS transporter [Burkholderiales bacterium]|nr:MFS transporter [Burkholderiales bacterium]
MSAVLSDPAARSDFRTIIVVGASHGTSHFFHLMLPPLFPWLMADFSLNYTQAGALMTVFFVVSGIGQALAGFVVDRFGARRVLFSGIALLAASGIVLAVAHEYATLAVAAAVAGLGNSVFHPADYTVLNRRVSPARLGHAFSVHGLSGNLGWAIAPVFMAGVAGMAGWRSAAIAAAAVGLVMLALLLSQRDAMAVPAHADPHPGSRSVPGSNSTLTFLGVPAVWMCFAYFVVGTMAFGVLQNFSPGALGGLYGLSLVVATSALSAYLLGGAAGIAAGGFLAGRARGHERIITLALGTAAAVALILAGGAAPGWAVIPLMVAMGFGSGVAGPSRDMLVRHAATGTLGPRAYGRVYGFVYSGLDVGLALAPLAFGPLMDQGRFGSVLAGVALLQVLAIGAALGVASQAHPARRA